MRRGRRPARHHAVSELLGDTSVMAACERIETEVLGWLAGDQSDGLKLALDDVQAVTATITKHSANQAEFTRKDHIAWAARKYTDAVAIAVRLTDLVRSAESARDTALAELASAAATQAEIPGYGVKFVQSLIAQGAGQADLHPATKAKARAVLGALRHAAFAETEEVRVEEYRAPPVRDWTELPREFSGFRLEDVGPKDELFLPARLPPSTDISDYCLDGMDPGEEETQEATYIRWGEIVADWAKRQGQVLDGEAQRAWVVLLGHRLKASNVNLKRFECGEFQSPWDPELVVKSVWIGA